MAVEVLGKPQSRGIEAGIRQTILLVDDDEVLLEVLARRLARQGFDTVTADSGESGLAKARADRPTLIVLDLRLPDRDGFDICRELDDSPETCGIPKIILSGMVRPDIIRRSRQVGCQYFVRKPYDPNVLLVLIRQAIDETNGGYS